MSDSAIPRKIDLAGSSPVASTRILANPFRHGGQPSPISAGRVTIAFEARSSRIGLVLMNPSLSLRALSSPISAPPPNSRPMATKRTMAPK
ncbi:MAG: hypothetical protein ACUVUT_04465, partial [Candidatus Bipolaricaulia bacterium]